MSGLIEIKRVPNAILYKDEKDQKYIKLLNCRASYPYLGKPAINKDDSGRETKKWRITFQLPHATHLAAKDLIKEVILDLCKQNKSNVESAFWFLSNGDKSQKETDHGYFLVSAGDQKQRPKVLDRKAQVVDDIEEIDRMIYGGCWVNGIIRPWFFDGKSKSAPGKQLRKLVSAGIQSVQHVRDDTPYGRGRIDDSDQYDAIEDDDGMGEMATTADDDEI